LLSLIIPKITYTHDLLGLYNQLPTKLTDSIEKQYYCLNNKANTNDLAELELRISTKEETDDEIKEWEKKNPPKKKEYTIKAVLERNIDMFVTWRYMYEVKSDLEFYNYEHLLLSYIATSLRNHLEHVLKKSQGKE